MKLKHIFQPNRWSIKNKNKQQEAGDDQTVQKKEIDPLADDVSKSNTASVSFSSSSSSRSSKKKRKSKKKDRSGSNSKEASSVPDCVVEHQTPNEKFITSFLAAMNNHQSMDQLLNFFSSPEVEVKFEDAPSITAAMWASETEKLSKSFPDIQYSYESIKQDHHGLVVVEELQVSGTHSGEPYSFAYFPPVPTTNKHIINDPERVWFKVKDGKIALVQDISLGDLTGPPGFYVQIGGKMDMPPPLPPSAEEEASAAQID
ncbi:expressed unknown protein [Seminavis robusta]|uniref:SnoaL-like domain-containing protein n=1 Tax=Seminavis robusta TaxID=568900 RepID=A0A9N8D5G1_9STRA|nr:expressed unknown protein [Seminavis robusta]|eukprot:Sro10_g007830.1 n/a (259) ;mRNA; r:16191-16967